MSGGGQAPLEISREENLRALDFIRQWPSGQGHWIFNISFPPQWAQDTFGQPRFMHLLHNTNASGGIIHVIGPSCGHLSGIM